jgi:pyruvate,water dikinase
MSQTEPSYVTELEKVSKDDPSVGDKAIAISELMKSGFSVPPGFVLSRLAFDKFAKSNKLESKISTIMKDMNAEDYQSIREVSERIQNLIINSNIPDYIERDLRDAYEELSVGKEAREVGGVALDLIKAGRGEAWIAVRPSKVGDYMDQGKTILNVRGPRKIFDAIKLSWASLFTVKAMIRRREKMAEGFPSIAIIVQKMVESDKSGVIFTYQPETQDRSRIVIEGIPGLGEAMFELATPDEYVINKETGEIQSKRIRRKLWMLKRDAMSGETIRDPISRRDMEIDVLNEKELIKLWELGLKLERQNGSHEVSWGMERGRIFLLNSKPIKEFSIPMEEQSYDGETISEGVSIHPGFTRGNTKLVLGQVDINKINEGDILVTRMTSDTMIPVSEEGPAMQQGLPESLEYHV